MNLTDQLPQAQFGALDVPIMLDGAEYLCDTARAERIAECRQIIDRHERRWPTMRDLPRLVGCILHGAA